MVRTVLWIIITGVMMVATAIIVNAFQIKTPFMDIQETVIVEKKVPVFKFVTYEYTVHTVEKIIMPGKDIFTGIFHSGDVTLLFEYTAKVEIDVNSTWVSAATIKPGKIDMSQLSFEIKVVDPTYHYLGQLVNNQVTNNSIPTEKIFQSINDVSNRIRELVMQDGGIELARKSFMEQYRQLFENHGLNIEFVNSVKEEPPPRAKEPEPRGPEPTERLAPQPG